ncbi:MAG: thioredoxin-dependent peroxiredoxin [Campylobacterota bacterium]|nr:thioredoxin-dependent peroxiredoxin [Campylobacterota bacterium]
MLEVGQKASEFSLPNQDGVEISLKVFKGKWLVLYFYPKDNTQGCTNEACDFTEQVPNFEDLNAVVIGVSPDTQESHLKFIESKKLNITLLSDTDKKVLKSYGAWGVKKITAKSMKA